MALGSARRQHRKFPSPLKPKMVNPKKWRKVKMGKRPDLAEQRRLDALERHSERNNGVAVEGTRSSLLAMGLKA